MIKEINIKYETNILNYEETLLYNITYVMVAKRCVVVYNSLIREMERKNGIRRFTE